MEEKILKVYNTDTRPEIRESFVVRGVTYSVGIPLINYLAYLDKNNIKYSIRAIKH